MQFWENIKAKTFWFSAFAIVMSVYGVTPDVAPTIQEWITAVTAILAIAAGRQAIGNAANGHKLSIEAPKKLGALLIGAGLLMGAGPAAATPAVAIYPALSLDRISGSGNSEDDWSTGLELGAEITEAPVYLSAAIILHDVFTEGRDAYPWDQTVRLEGGLYREGAHVGDVGLTPYGGLILARPSIEDWSVGLTLGVEVDFEPVWLRVANDWQDIVTERNVYPWDTTFRLAVGAYFGGGDEDEDEPQGRGRQGRPAGAPRR